MKSQKGFSHASDDDVLRKPAKLEPAHKSGKEKRSIYGFDDDIDESEEDFSYRKKESVLDYFDDGDDDEDS